MNKSRAVQECLEGNKESYEVHILGRWIQGNGDNFPFNGGRFWTIFWLSYSLWGKDSKLNFYLFLVLKQVFYMNFQDII